MKQYNEFRQSAHQPMLAQFLSSPTGFAFIQVLKESAKPSVAAKASHGTHDDVKFQMALNLVSSIERNQMIEEIERLSLPITLTDKQRFEPLEDDSDFTQKKNKTNKKK